MRSSLFIFALLAACPAQAEDAQKSVLCGKVMQPMMEMTGTIPEAMDLFTNLHANQLDRATAKQFDDVEKAGQELKRASEAYRKAFVLACFGD